MSGNFIHIAPPEAYNQVYNYYQRVIGDGGTLIDAEAVNRIYHNLNLVNFENRNYKLYHASAGLQKTSDKIDKLYDLGKDDIDQTFSGSDRPEHVQAWSNSEGVGNYQISVEKESTNYFKESNDIGYVAQGNINIIENYADSPFGDPNEASLCQFFESDGGQSGELEINVNQSEIIKKGEYLTISGYFKRLAGTGGVRIGVSLGDAGNFQALFNLFLGNATFGLQQATPIGEWQYFEYTFQNNFQDDTFHQRATRIIQAQASDDTEFLFWGFQIEHGRYATSRIHTDGSTTTRLAPDSELENFYPEEGTIVMWFNQVYQPGDGGNNSMVFSDEKNNYYVRLRDNLPNALYFQWQIEEGKYTGANNDLKSLFNIQGYQDFKVCVALSWSKNNQKKLIVNKNGTADLKEANELLSFTGSKNVKIGQWAALGTRSCHKIQFENIYKSKEISNVKELKELVASLSKYEGGANLELKDIILK